MLKAIDGLFSYNHTEWHQNEQENTFSTRTSFESGIHLADLNLFTLLQRSE